MNPHFGILSLTLSFYACANDVVEGKKTDVAPEVTQGDKKFFGKDYPWDKRPKVDVFHFKHPYPVVQDSNDFDKDFIKDENSDDGSWKAQSEYDRLRHKLAMEKEAVVKAAASKENAEKELQEAMKRKELALRKTTTQPPAREGSLESSRGISTETNRMDKNKVGKGEPGGIASPGDVRVATTDTKRAMDSLQECKKQLSDARENLKKLMKELEGAKEQQRETQAVLDSAVTKEKEVEVTKKSLDTGVKSDYAKYMGAREEYLKQQAMVARMENDIEVASKKVTAFRDAEDKEGGIYNSGGHAKSAAQSAVSHWFAFILSVVACLAH